MRQQGKEKKRILRKRYLLECTEHPQAYLRVEQMRVHHGSFDIIQVGVVFKSSLQQACLLTQLSNMGTIIVGEHLVPQNRICYLKGFIHT